MNEEITKQKKRIDMLQGSIMDKLFLFALPLAASSILQQLFNAVDIAVVGRFASSQAQAAVGSNGPFINLLLNIFVGLSVGTNVVIAHYVGQGKKSNIQDTVHTSIVVALISGFFILGLGVYVTRPVLTMMNTPKDVLELAALYLHIYFLGMPFIMLYNFGAAILRSVGDTKRPLICLFVSGVINAGLNMILVIVFHMGVAGVAIATVVSNAVSATMILYFLIHEKEPIVLHLDKLRISKKELLKMIRIGVPAGIQGMVFSVANIFIQSALNGYGSNAVAGSAVALNYEYITYFVIAAFNQTTVTFTSQNYGARNFERCKKVFCYAMILSSLITACLSLTIVIGRGFFIALFTSKPMVAHFASVRILRILTTNFIISSYEIGGAALRGMGYSMTPALLTVFGTCAFRLGWIYTVCKKYKSYEMLLNVYPISWVITGVAVLLAYFIIRKKCLKET